MLDDERGSVTFWSVWGFFFFLFKLTTMTGSIEKKQTLGTFNSHYLKTKKKRRRKLCRFKSVALLYFLKVSAPVKTGDNTKLEMTGDCQTGDCVLSTQRWWQVRAVREQMCLHPWALILLSALSSCQRCCRDPCVRVGCPLLLHTIITTDMTSRMQTGLICSCSRYTEYTHKTTCSGSKMPCSSLLEPHAAFCTV